MSHIQTTISMPTDDDEGEDVIKVTHCDEGILISVKEEGDPASLIELTEKECWIPVSAIVDRFEVRRNP